MSAEDGDNMAPGWLQALAWADECTLAVAAALVVDNCVDGITVEDWRALTTAERAALAVARSAARIQARARSLADAGQDMGAAAAYAPVDGGRAAARLMAQAAGQGVAEARRQAKAKP